MSPLSERSKQTASPYSRATSSNIATPIGVRLRHLSNGGILWPRKGNTEKELKEPRKMLANCERARKTKIMNVDFGEVEVGRTAVKTIKIVNESCKDQVYEVQRDPITNPLDYVFDLRVYAWTLAPEEEFTCEICFRPFLAFSKSVDYFNIVDSIGACIGLTVRGTGIGSQVSCSATKLTFRTDKIQETRKRIKLTNSSKAKGIFTFDVDVKHNAFKLDLTHGIIEPQSYKYITITFSPPERGLYTYFLPCLILNEDPIIIQLYGYCGSPLQKPVFERFTYPSIENGFEGYMSDSVQRTEHRLPLVSFSKHYLDFGQADTETEKLRVPQTVCFTNHSERDVSIKWDKDTEGIFNITPSVTRVRSEESALFVMSFRPDVKCSFFEKELIGLVSNHRETKSTEYLEFPLMTSVRVTGHSFPIGSPGWIPQYKIPQTVVMPACVPPHPVHTTFLIKKFGHLPLMFRFVAPSASHFTVKPVLGVIRRDYQVIALEMFPETKGQHVYMERWAVYFNGNPRNEVYIDFKGYAEYADVSFSNEGNVEFASVYPGCRQTEQVVMRNVTRHTIMYRFINVPVELEIDQQIGELSCNEILSQDWTFFPKETGDYEFEIECVVTVVMNKIFIGPEVRKTLRVTGRSEVGYLMATPDELNFGVQAYGDTQTLYFHVFNFSSVNMYYKLICSHQSFEIGCIESDVKMHPSSETIFPGKSKKIAVSLTPRTPGYYQLLIQYLVRVSSQTDSVIAEQVPTDLCKVNCLCVLPILQVKDIYTYGPSSDMNKLFFWETLKIDELNTILKTILPGEHKTLNIQFPSMISNKKPILIKLFVTNTTEIAVSWILKRIQQCSCKPVTKPRGISFQTITYNCIHKEVCSVHPNSGNLKMKEEAVITIELHCQLIGTTEIKWDLDIGYNRHIFLNITVETISGSEEKLKFLHGTHLKFDPIWFGDKDPIFQMCWIQNSTNNNVSYSVNTAPLCKFNESHYSKIFSCMTPCGIVEPRSSKPIIFRFQPRQFGKFQIKLPVTLGEEETELTLEGDSCYFFTTRKSKQLLPTHYIHKIQDISVYFNKDCIYFPLVPMHSKITKMLMVYNNMCNDVLAYEWQSSGLPGIIYVKIYPEKGIIQPKRVQSFHVTVITYGCPCKITVNVPCKFINASQRRAYQRSILKHDILSQELEGQFTITEKSVITPEPWVKILEKPEPFYKTLAIQCSMYSPEDETLKLDLIEELKSIPPNEISTDKFDITNNDITYEENEVNISSFILECMLWEILHSKSFKERMQKDSEMDSNLTYSQFVMSLSERKRLIERSYITPSKRLIESILERMLFVIVHEEFVLDTVHLLQQKDIRHTNYLQTFAKTIHGKIEGGTLDKKLKSLSTATVSFAE